MYAIEIDDLRRTYETRQGILKRRKQTREALKGISFNVERGELFGLLGPNGAGKTTLTKILSTILLPTAGSARIAGCDIVGQTEQVRRRIGLVLGGERGLYYRLTALENMQFWSALYGLDSRAAQSRIPGLLKLLGLESRSDERIENFSRGMKQRLHLARGLLGQPEVLFLDEPTVGLDPVAARELRTIIKQLQDTGMTIFLTTHQMAEAEALCDRVAFINEGSVALIDTPAALTRVSDGMGLLEADVGLADPIDLVALRNLPGVAQIQLEPIEHAQRIRITLHDQTLIPGVLQHLSGLPVRHIQSHRPSLEDVYLRLMGSRGLSV